jgi:DNA-binding MarR family transcriptional regulator
MSEDADKAAMVARMQNAATRLMRQARLLDEGSSLTSAQYSALSTLYNHPDLPLMELARLEYVSHPTMSRLVTGLLKHGFVERTSDLTDRRSTRLNLTQAGRETYRRVYDRRLKLIAMMTAQLKPETIADLLKVMENVPQLGGPNDK